MIGRTDSAGLSINQKTRFLSQPIVQNSNLRTRPHYSDENFENGGFTVDMHQMFS